MDPRSEFVTGDSLRVLKFFHINLCEEVAGLKVTKAEVIYVATILASYAQTSRHDHIWVPPMNDLSEVFDNFVLRHEHETDPVLLEIAGAQSFFLVGFCRDQMARRHHLGWYEKLGQSFYWKAGLCARKVSERELFTRLAYSFPPLAKACCNLNRNFRDNRYLLQLPGMSEPRP